MLQFAIIYVMQLQNKVAVVTGGNSGLGFSIAKNLLVRGCIVYILGKDKTKLAQAALSLASVHIHTLVADVTDYNALSDAAKQITPDILINNAGIYIGGNLSENNSAQISAVVDVNLKGPIFATRAFLPQMQKRKSGFIVNVSSTVGIKTKAGEAVYGASKFGLRGFTEALEQELFMDNIRVLGFYPGGMHTQLFVKGGSPKENDTWMDPDNVAQLLVSLLEQDDSMTVSHVEVNRKR